MAQGPIIIMELGAISFRVYEMEKLLTREQEMKCGNI
jgi:hypothetical protein